MSSPTDSLEIEARDRAISLHATGKLGRHNGQPLMDTLGYNALTLTEQAESRRLQAAMQAAHDADTFVALAKGDIVPTHRIDQGLLDYHRRRSQHRPPQGGGV